jgi:pimeloyl-ACP methyl ester carboxylesterase
VIGAGHSMGAAIWMIAAATYPDNAGVNGLILADYLHNADAATQAALQAARHRAQEDPKFADAGLPEGYFTTKPGFRYLYYNPDFVDSRVLAADEELKQTSTIGEGITINLARDPVYASKITVPVLLVVGQKDSLFCNESMTGLSCANKSAVLDRELPAYNQHACLEAYVLPVAGHDTNLHYNAQKWFNEAGKWSDRRVGENLWHVPTDPC